MSGCEGCWTNNKGQDESLQAIREQAKKYSEENRVSIAIYKEGFDYRFIRLDIAISESLGICDVVPFSDI